jgi:hypothetical protein
MKYTPGPWVVEGFNPPRVYARDGIDIICQCDSMEELTLATEKANAYLIAAAPDMLAALRRLANECDGEKLGTVQAPTWATLCAVETLLHDLELKT